MSALFSEDMEILCDNIITVTVQFTFTFIELTSSVPLAEFNTGRHLSSKR